MLDAESQEKYSHHSGEYGRPSGERLRALRANDLVEKKWDIFPGFDAERAVWVPIQVPISIQ